MNTTRPFAVKGIGFTTPKGQALWCKSIEPDRKFNAKGDLTTSLVCDPNNEAVKEFVKQLEGLRDTALAETIESLGAVKAKQVKARDVFYEDTDRDGNATGNILFKLKLSSVDDRKEGGRQHSIKVVDAKKNVIEIPPQVGNGSVIRCAGFANPYYMASSKEVGVSLIWQKMQIINLVDTAGSDDFGEEDGFESSSSAELEEAPF